jgi:WD40 repeat protein
LAAGISCLAIGGLAVTIITDRGDPADGPGSALESRPSSAPPVTPATRRDERVLAGGPDRARHVAFSTAGDRLLAVRDRGVDVWRVDGTRVAWLAVSGDRVAGATWSPDGQNVLTWGPDGTVRWWRADRPAMIKTVQAGMGFVAEARVLDDTRVETLATDGTRRTWELATGRVQVQRGRPTRTDMGAAAETMTADGRWRAFVDERGEVRLRCVSC